MGGIYSTANDLSALGRSILLHSSFAQHYPGLDETDHSHLTLTRSVGRHWEIYRLVLPQPDNRVTDIYTKSSSLGLYSSILALPLDYGVGFVTLAAGQGSHAALDGLIADIALPEFETIARKEADSVYEELIPQAVV
jgi:hypothetical protein